MTVLSPPIGQTGVFKTALRTPRFAGANPKPPILEVLKRDANLASDWHLNSVVTKDGGVIIGEEVAFKLDNTHYRLKRIGPTYPQYLVDLNLKATHVTPDRNHAVMTLETDEPGKPPETTPLDEDAMTEVLAVLKAEGKKVLADQFVAEMLQNGPQGELWSVKISPPNARKYGDDLAFSVGKTRYQITNFEDQQFFIKCFEVQQPDKLYGSFGTPAFPISQAQYTQLVNKLTPLSTPVIARTYGLLPNLDASPVLAPLPKMMLDGSLTYQSRLDGETATQSGTNTIFLTMPPENKLSPKTHWMKLEIKPGAGQNQKEYTLSIFREGIPNLDLPLSYPGEKSLAELIGRIVQSANGKQAITKLVEQKSGEITRLESEKVALEQKLAKAKEDHKFYQEMLIDHMPKIDAKIKADVAALDAGSKPTMP